MKKRNTIAILVLLAAICVMGYTGPQLIEAEQAWRDGNEAYNAFSEQVKQGPTEGSPAQAPQADMGTANAYGAQANMPAIKINYKALNKISRNATAWLYCPDTVIDYPVMKADDYDYYLRHLPDGAPNANGALFIDYNCAPDFSDPLTIIYGHHMRSGSMFGSLKGYKEQNYYYKHPCMYLYTPQGDYRIELLYGCVIGAGQWRERAFMYSENLGELLAYAEHNTTFKSGTAYAEGDRVVAMSTCSYEFDDARYVVIGILTDPITGNHLNGNHLNENHLESEVNQQ